MRGMRLTLREIRLGAATRRLRNSRSAVVAGTNDVPGFLWKGTMQIVAIVVLAVSSFSALAEPVRARGAPTTKQAQAYLDFRIVIPETLHIGSVSERHRKSLAFVSRTLQAEGGRTILTVARP